MPVKITARRDAPVPSPSQSDAPADPAASRGSAPEPTAPRRGASVQSAEHRVLGAAAKETRIRRGLSQEGLGIKAGLHRNYVGAIERGEINPTWRVLRKLAHGLELPLSELIALFETRLYERSAADREPRRRW